jgi:hypothetical protein
VTFYWVWPDALGETEQFNVYVRTAGGRRSVGAVPEANMGGAYWLRVTLDEVLEDGEGGPIVWQVQLEETSEGRALARSAERPLTILPGG